MPDAVSTLTGTLTYFYAAWIAAIVLLVIGVVLWMVFGLGRQNAQIKLALAHMSQGLCMWDRDFRLVVCNQRYIEMFRMDPAFVKPGRLFREILEHRASVGSFKGNVEQYVADVMSRVAQQKVSSQVFTLADGRVLSVCERPLPEGGWVATLEDVTERHHAEQQQAAARANDARRSGIESTVSDFRGNMEKLLAAVNSTAAAMQQTSVTLLESSDQAARNAQDAVGTSNTASSAVATAASGAQELTGSIEEIGRQLAVATDVVRLAVGEANATNTEIKGLADAAQKIGDVVELIRTIAGQTNLLALNATIEAARAGESGRGFAVVASEVKSLAVQTAKATEEISSQIASVQTSTATAVEAIRRMTSRMQEIDQVSSAVAAAVEEQSAVTSAITQNVANAKDATTGVVSVLDRVAGAAGDTRKSAEIVMKSSGAVEAAVSNLRGEVEQFLTKVAV
jgi:methyl-accepting chemotaxis protein